MKSWAVVIILIIVLIVAYALFLNGEYFISLHISFGVTVIAFAISIYYRIKRQRNDKKI